MIFFFVLKYFFRYGLIFFIELILDNILIIFLFVFLCSGLVRVFIVEVIIL